MVDTSVPEPGTSPDAEADSIAAFAEGLRDLRTAAGNPTLAAMSDRTGISKSVISVALTGRVLPTENTVLKLVDDLGGDLKEWRARRNALDPKHAGNLGVGDAGAEQSGGARRFSTAQTILIAAGAAAVAALASGLIVGSVSAAAPAEPGSGRHLSEAANGIDPMLTACRDDAVIAASEARLDNKVHVQLMYSNDCMAVWGRVTRYDNQTEGNTMTMRVWPLDDPQSDRAQSRTDIGLQSLYTPMLIEPDTAARVCGQATVTVDGKTENLGPEMCI
ncbi:hypothetical protein FM113_14335 [Leucobacter sp. 7(1)]|uniref:DUF2690 domain-containing protein n=1 Tax=Leucobacter sp. 7(1) TaxID=1255613 RepID=UPI00097EAC9B|nr:DUF2690 domain-containing protein [Leucobacter sp. 7(1)]SJN12243.1 hypothetical protein FM113_14335 [Leucobacter sp. 7(1)]